MVIKRKLAVLAIALSVLLIFSITASFSNASHSVISEEPKSITIDEDSLDVTKKDLQEYENYTSALANKLKKADKCDYSKIIKNFNKNEHCAVRDAADELVENINDKYVIDKTSYLATVDEKLKQTYRLNDTETVTITPLYIAEEEFKKNPEKNEENISEPLSMSEKIKNFFIDSASAASKTKSTGTIYARRTLKSWVGLKIVSVHVQCNFYYNGNKAWYKSNFDSHYERGSGLNPWTCSQWKSKKEKDGTSYTAWARGVFCYGLQYNGNGLVIQEAVCKAKITCSKKGKISKTYIPSL